MSFFELVKKRRSCRKYLSRPIVRETLQRCLEAARLAPSACNSQPWHFIVVQDKFLKDELSRVAFSGVHSMNSFAKEAPVLVVVVRNKSLYSAQLGGQLRGTQYNLIDLGIACQHLILQAQEEGLGSCWIGWFDERAVKKILKVPRDKKVDIIISLGYSGEKLQEVKTRKLLSEISEFR